jgi:hypothetical protein
MSWTLISRGTFGRLAPKATGVSQLDAGHRPILLQEVVDAGQRLYMVVQPNTAIGRADASFGRNGGGLDHSQPRTSYRTGAEMHEMPIVRKPVVRRLLAHRRDGDPVPQHDILQPKFVKQTCHEKSLRSTQRFSPDKLAQIVRRRIPLGQPRCRMVTANTVENQAMRGKLPAGLV